MFDFISRQVIRRPKGILWGALVITLVAAIFGSQAFGVLKTAGFDNPNSQSVAARKLINDNFGGDQNLVILVDSKNGSADDDASKQVAQHVAGELNTTSGISNVTSYAQLPSPALRSNTGKYGLITAHIAGSDEAVAKIAKHIDKKLTIKTSSVEVAVGGQAGSGNAISNEVAKSLGIAEAIAVPLTIVFLLVAFGTVASASLPLLVSLLAIIMTFAELFLLAKVTDVSIYAINLTTALGLGLAVDYSLFIVNRYREELGEGASVAQAVSTSIATAGRTVAFSAVAVTFALAAMLVFPLYFLKSFAYAGIGVVIASAVVSVIVLPAVLLVLGNRIEKGRLPWARRVSKTEAPVWRRIANFVMKRPLMTAIPAILLLILVASPIRNISVGTPDDRVIRPGNNARIVGDVLRKDFPTNLDGQLQAVVKNDRAADYALAASQLPHVDSVAGQNLLYVSGKMIGRQQTKQNSIYSLITVQTKLDSQSKQAAQLVTKLRNIQGSVALVDGRAASLLDTKNAITNSLPIGIGFIAITTFVILFIFTGSLLQPLRALLTNGLTLAAAFGVVVWIFQYGNLHNLLQFTPLPINISMPVLLFCVSFGLSMDYELFILSRIKEQHDTGRGNLASVSHGLARAGRIVSTAAIMLAVSFLAFASGSISFLQIFGIGTAVAILIDATIVRGILVPASMRLMGSAAWYAPLWLKRFTFNEQVTPTPAEVVSTR